jgi:hypothetical protein
MAIIFPLLARIIAGNRPCRTANFACRQRYRHGLQFPYPAEPGAGEQVSVGAIVGVTKKVYKLTEISNDFFDEGEELSVLL